NFCRTNTASIARAHRYTSSAERSIKTYGYKRIETILKTNCLRSAQEIANAIHADYALWQDTQRRRDDVTAVFFQL
ncbi:MAG: hypothetical protein EB110_06150, partial [Betaproteobacteria bacterium]|nr:hypothetical protein [Betaproteobacteria bacterium]